MKRNNGWLDWRVTLAMSIFLLLMLCALYSESRIFKYLAFIPAAYGIFCTFRGAKFE